MNQAFWLLHTDLPREGPGSDASTLAALRMLPNLDPRARVVDVGCGPGRQTLVLARTLGTSITAVDLHKPYLERLALEVGRLGLGSHVQGVCASMDALPFPENSIDLIWAEGSIFCIGLVAGLRSWRPLLHEHGMLAFTEASWFTPDPPPEALSYWESMYPDIMTETANIARITAEGYEVLGTFRLPASDWWDEYYTPLQRRIERLRPGAADDPSLHAEIAGHEQEISMHSRFGFSYGYVFYALRKSTGST